MAEAAKSLKAAEVVVPADYISADAAARALGKSRRTVQLWCKQGKLPAVRDESGAWFIDPRSRAEFSLLVHGAETEGPMIAPAGSPLAGMSIAHREKLMSKREVVEAWFEYLADKPLGYTVKRMLLIFVDAHNELNPNAKPLTVRTLQRWISDYKRDGLAGLADKRSRNGSDTTMCEAAQKFVLGLYARQERPAVTRVHELLCAAAYREGWEVPGLRAVQAWVSNHDRKLLNAGREPKKHRDRSTPTIKRDWTKVAAMECIVGDHHQFDILWPRLVIDEVKGGLKWAWRRPWLTAWLDARSWYCWSNSIAFDGPDGDRVMASFLSGVMAHGAPDSVYLDNGKDYRMKRFAGGRIKHGKSGEKIVAEKHTTPILEMFGIRVVWAIPYNARAKVIEPWFKIVEERFGKTHKTYIANKPERRPERLKGLHGRGKCREWALKLLGPDIVAEAEKWADKTDQDVRDKAVLNAFRNRFNRWLNDDYHRRESPAAASSGRSAVKAFYELRSPGFVKRVPAEQDLQLLLMRSKPINVGNNGVWCGPHRKFYWADSLNALRANGAKKRVAYRYMPDDDSRIFVFDFETDRFLAVAEPYIGQGLHPLKNRESLRLGEAMALQRHYAKDDRKQLREAITMADRLLADHRLAADHAGKLSEAESEIAARQQNRPAVKIKFAGSISDAGTADIEHKRTVRRKKRTEDFFNSDIATGTDDIAPAVQQANPLDELMD